MRFFDCKSTAVAMVVAVGVLPLKAEAAVQKFDTNPLVMKMRQAVKPVRPFRGEKPWGVGSAEMNARHNKNNIRKVAESQPSMEFTELSAYDFLDAPDGTTWFYTTEYDIQYEQVSEWYTEENIVGYTFTIYDSAFNKVGTIKDKITLGEGETRVAGAVLDPALSARFFNTDDKYEVMVYLVMNTSAIFNYEVHYYNKVYSVGGEKDSYGNDVCLATIPGRCVDAFNVGGAGSENCFYTFVEDIYPNPDDFSSDQYVDYINAAKTHVSVFSKAVGNAGPVAVCEKDIFMTRYPGDTTDGIYLITKTVNGTPYFIFSQYEKPYFVDPTGMASDESATEDNSLVIETCKYENGSMINVSTTKIPVEIKKVANEVNYTFYSIGSVAWKDDVDMSVNGTPQAPAFLVARDVTKASNLEEVASSYDIYGNDGTHIHTLAENTDAITVLASIEGKEPQAMFVNVSGNGDYTFNFIDLYSGAKALSLSQIFKGEELTASCQRVADKAGSCKYVFEMKYDDVDDEGNDIKRMAWINQDGTFDRIDRINMGKDIMASSVNMYATALSSHLYDDDDAMEYAVLVKRVSGETTRNEFLVVDDSGKWYAQFSEADGKGAPTMFTVLPGLDKNRLQMVYITDDNTFNVDIYDLPFVTGLTSVKDAYALNAGVSAISFNGTAVMAQGSRIEVYNAAGSTVAVGNDRVSLEPLSHGIYIAVARDVQGNTASLKIVL